MINSLQWSETMEVIRGIQRLSGEKNVITLGNFDGVHLGHRRLFEFVKRKASSLGGRSVVVTFNPHPIKVLFENHPLKLLTTTEDKLRLIEKSGIDITVIIPFTRDFAQIEAQEFVRDVLVKNLCAKWVVIGYDYKFGRDRKGNHELLRELGEVYGFKVTVVNAYKRMGKILSSTAVRNALYGGNVCEAALFLGRAYHVDGVVVKGAGRGSSVLGYPTANILPKQEIIPKEGVYAVKVSFPDSLKTFKAVANIGRNPTFGNSELSFEVHILNFRGELLGKTMRVHFIARLRDEKKFKSPLELKEAIARDIERAKEIFRIDRTRLYLDSPYALD